MALQLSSKRIQIDKANAMIFGIMAGAAFVATFSLVATRALLDKRSYQSRIISAKEDAVKQLKENIDSVASLEGSYKAFVDVPQNVLGGNSTGEGERDGDNARITLDALPSKYDFPALATSLEKITTERKLVIGAITGTDDEVNQQKLGLDPKKAVPMPFTVNVSGGVDATQELIKVLSQDSIRPFRIETMDIGTGSSAANGSDIQLNITASTYFLPEKTLTIGTKEIK